MAPYARSFLGRPAERSATYEDVLALPANTVGQLLFGVLHAHPRPAPKHAPAAWPRRPGRMALPMEPELHLGPHVLVTELASDRIVDVFTADAKARAVPFDAVELSFADLWARGRPSRLLPRRMTR